MKEFIKNQIGSTLLMVLITTATLTILGVAVISMTFMNINMKYNDYSNKKAMYYSESGLDQVYAIVGSKVDAGLAVATANTGIYMEALKANLEASFSDLDSSKHGKPALNIGTTSYDDMREAVINRTDKSYYKIVTTTPQIDIYDKVLDDAVFQDTANKLFKLEFQLYFNALSEADLIASISTIKKIDTAVNQPIISFDPVDPIIPFFSTGSTDTYVLKNVKSTFSTASTEKIITTDVVVKAPELQYPLKITENRISIEDNPLWHNALLSNSNIIFNGGSSVISGTVYGFGVTPTSASDKMNSDTYGGVIANSDSNVSITGDVITRNNVAVSGTAQLNVTNGHVYASSVLTKSTAVAGAKISATNSNVYTMDDLELNGDGSQIDINGSYYGFANGSVATTSHDSSSCILVNAAIGSGAILKIDGLNPNADLKFDEATDNHGVFIGGTAYVNISGKTPGFQTQYWPYQTGESVSIKGNYLAYTQPLTQALEPKYLAANTILGFAQSSIDVGFVVSSSIGGDFVQADKLKYFMSYHQYEPTPLTTGNGMLQIPLSKYQYSLGAHIGTDATSATQIMTAFGSDSVFNALSADIYKDYNYILHTSMNREDSQALQVGWQLDTTGYGDHIIDSYALLGGTMPTVSISEKPFAGNPTQTATEVVCVSTTKNVELLGEGLTAGTDPSIEYITLGTHSGNRYQGIILTKGNVKISGNVNFTGTIIAEGNITVDSHGSTNVFRNGDATSMEFLAKLIRKTSNLREIFAGSISKPIIPAGLAPLDYIESTAISSGTNANFQRRYKELIEYAHWKVN